VRTARGYHALACDFSLAVDDDELGEHLEWLFDAFPEPQSARCYEVRASEDAPGYELRLGDHVETQGHHPAAFFSSLVQWINRTAVDPSYALTSHAGGVERDGVACVLPADPESGKTTLTTGLVRAGFSYLSDEAVAFDWVTGTTEPFPKPLSIDPGSQHLFPDLRPPIEDLGIGGSDDESADQRQVPPRAIRADAVGGAARAALLVFPKYVADASTHLEPISRAEALIEMAKSTFSFRDQSRRALDALAPVVRDAGCARLVVGDLDEACAIVAELMAQVRA
jgi:hypothetical protein